MIRFSIVSFVLCALLILPPACGERDRSGPEGREVDVWEFLDGDLSRLGEFTGAKSVMFSSYDRTGGNDDGFSGLWSCLRIDGRGERIYAVEPRWPPPPSVSSQTRRISATLHA